MTMKIIKTLDQMKTILDLIVKENGKFIVQISLTRYEFETEAEAFGFIRNLLSCRPSYKLKKTTHIYSLIKSIN